MSKSTMKRMIIVEEFMRLLQSMVSVLFLLGACSVSAEAEFINWNQLRGPNGAGIAAGFKPPLKIVADQAKWKTSKATYAQGVCTSYGL